MSDQQPIDGQNTGKPADFNLLEDSRKSYFSIKRNVHISGCLLFLISCLGIFLVTLDPPRASMWLGFCCAFIPISLAVAIQSIRSLRALHQRQRALNTSITHRRGDWISSEAAIIESELEWLDRGRTIATVIFLAGFILVIGILITGKPLLVMGAGIGLSIAGGLLLSAILVIEIHTKEYAYRLDKASDRLNEIL